MHYFRKTKVLADWDKPACSINQDGIANTATIEMMMSRADWKRTRFFKGVSAMLKWLAIGAITSRSLADASSVCSIQISF